VDYPVRPPARDRWNQPPADGGRALVENIPLHKSEFALLSTER
jgi:hypothetical protein